MSAHANGSPVARRGRPPKPRPAPELPPEASPREAPRAAPEVNRGPAIEFWPLDKLTPYARNARTHSEQSVADLAGSIAEFGFTGVVLADERGIIAGHARTAALRLLFSQGRSVRMTAGGEVPHMHAPVLNLSSLTETQRQAYIIADNKHALNAGWDDDMLRAELQELGGRIDISLTGFSDAEIGALFSDGVGLGGEEGDDIPDGDDYKSQFGVIVICANEAEQAAVYERLSGEGLNCKVVVT